MSRRVRVTLLLVVVSLSSPRAPARPPNASSPSPQSPETPAEGTARDRVDRIVLLSGEAVEGPWQKVEGGAVDLISSAGASSSIPFYEVGELLPLEGAALAGKAPVLDKGALVAFAGGELLRARVLALDGSRTTLRLAEGGGDLQAPLESLKGFRLREANADDTLFEVDLRSTERPSQDTVYVRRDTGLLRVPGVLRGLDEEFLTLEYEGVQRRLRRSLVLGVILARAATATPEADIPATFDLGAAGAVAAFLVRIASREGERSVELRFRGASDREVQSLPAARVHAIRFQSDRVRFLSQLEPARVVETPLVGGASSFPYRRDLTVSGAPIRLGDRVYRRGLGVHSRSTLEYALDGTFTSFSAVLGLDASAIPGATVTFSVVADGKELLREPFGSASPPRAVSLPIEGVQKLELTVDYGEDGNDQGDHAVWADARIAH